MSEQHIHFHNPSDNLGAPKVLTKPILGRWEFTNSTIGGADLFIRDKRNKASTISISKVINAVNSVGSGTNGIATLPANAYISSLSTSYLAINNNTTNIISSITSTISSTTSGLWVAVGNAYPFSNSIQYSVDGLNWSNVRSNNFPNTSMEHYGVAYGNGLWVTVGRGNPLGGISTIKYSGDGSNWSNANSGFSNNLGDNPVGRGVAYGNGLWVAVGRGNSPNNTILYGNGSNWSNANSGGFSNGINGQGYGISYQGNGVAYGNGLWVATGFGNSSTTTIKYSRDGSNWSNAVNSGFDNNYNGNGNYGNGVAYANGLWVAVGRGSSSSNSLLYSVNGSNWSSTLKGGFYASNGINVAYGNGLWVACGYGPTLNDSILFGDGSNWSNTTGNTTGGFGCSGLAYGNGLWVGAGFSTRTLSTIRNSTDGSNWYPSISGGFNATYNNYGRDVAYRERQINYSYTSTMYYNTPLININSHTSINLVDNIFSLSYSNLTLKFTPNLMSTLISMM